VTAVFRASLRGRLFAALIGTSVAAATPWASQRVQPRTFDAERAGPPEGFTFAAMRQPKPGAWTVRRDGANGVLVHPADASASGYALAIAAAPTLQTLAIAVRLRLIGGARTGGVVWQYQDENNHYAAVLDLSQQELSMYRVVAGNRTRLEFEDDLELDPDAWHTMKVVHTGDEIAVSLGGIEVFEEHGRSTRVSSPGRAGVIAAGNSEVWFDDWRVEDRQRGR
jgi:hypothetical protein